MYMMYLYNTDRGQSSSPARDELHARQDIYMYMYVHVYNWLKVKHILKLQDIFFK